MGTTTIAMLLYREDGSVADRYVALNPQAVYGADVLSRIQAAEDKTCREEMYRQVRGILEKGVRRFGRLLQEGESLYMVLAANTAMTYLLMGWDSVELGRAPFTAGHLSAAVTEAAGDVRLCGWGYHGGGACLRDGGEGRDHTACGSGHQR